MQIVVLFWVRKFTHLHEKDNYMFDPDDSLVFVTTLLLSMDLLWGAIIVTLTCFFLLQEVNIMVSIRVVRWGVVEWIERPLLMLEVRGLNLCYSISKNTFSLPRSPRGSPRSRAHPRISELSERGGVKKSIQAILNYSFELNSIFFESCKPRKHLSIQDCSSVDYSHFPNPCTS